jgi:hypothetical protein
MSSVNDIIRQVNSLTGYNMPTASYVYTTGSVPAGATVYVVPPQSGSGPGNTIPTTGIYPGGVIKAEQILNIINALNGVSAYDIIMAGSLYVSGSSTMQSNLDLPFIPDQDILYSSGGFTTGTNTLDGGTF